MINFFCFFQIFPAIFLFFRSFRANFRDVIFQKAATSSKQIPNCENDAKASFRSVTAFTHKYLFMTENSFLCSFCACYCAHAQKKASTMRFKTLFFRFRWLMPLYALKNSLLVQKKATKWLPTTCDHTFF